MAITDVREEDGTTVLDLDCRLVNGDDDAVVTGSATALAPTA